MAIPDFDPHGNLPPGRHRASGAQIGRALVDAFPTSKTRSSIFEYWRHHHRALADVVAISSQWLAGSFTSDKPDPNDVDIVSIIDGVAFDELPRHRQLVVRTLIDGHYTEQFWNCDAYPVLAYPEGHAAHSKFTVALTCFEHYFDADRNGDKRGFVEVTW